MDDLLYQKYTAYSHCLKVRLFAKSSHNKKKNITNEVSLGLIKNITVIPSEHFDKNHTILFIPCP